MGRETYFPQLAILVPERQSCACLRGQYTLRKIITRHSNHVPRLISIAPQHRRCPTSRDFVPWRFSGAGRRSAWIASSCRHPKTCTTTDSCKRRKQQIPARLQSGWAQNLACWAISSIGSRTEPGGRLACWLLAKKLISAAASFLSTNYQRP